MAQGNNVIGDDGSSLEESKAYAYALGQMSPAEEREFEAALQKGTSQNAHLDEALQTMEVIAERVSANAPAPRMSLKSSIMLAAIGSTNSLETENQRVVRNDESEWIQDPGSEGILIKILHKEDETGIYTVLAKLEPGASYPPHRHKGVEQCFVISGSIQVNDILLQTGDYIVSPDGTLHHKTYTETGCLLILNTLLEDEMLA